MGFRHVSQTAAAVATCRYLLLLLQASGVRVQRVVITRLVDQVFYARIILQLTDGALASVDARPSDALCLAAAANADIFVSKVVAE